MECSSKKLIYNGLRKKVNGRLAFTELRMKAKQGQ